MAILKCMGCNAEILYTRKPFKKCPECQHTDLRKVINGKVIDPAIYPEDGPGWQTVSCDVCGTEIGKRPPGSQIDPNLCPNVVNHVVEGAGVSETTLTNPQPADTSAPISTETGEEAPVVTMGRSLTVELPPLGFEIPADLASMLETSGSEIGYSAVSGYLTCPEKSRLRAQLKRIPIVPSGSGSDGPAIRNLAAAEYGTFIHAMLSIRVCYGTEQMLQALDFYGQWMYPEDKMKATNLLMTYDNVYPLDKEPFEYIGCEVEVYTDIGGAVRTARYDKIVKYQSGVASLEHKTASSASPSAMDQYRPQFMTQMVIWNANQALVDKYGPMISVIADQLAKTVVPQVHRQNFPFEKHHYKIVQEFLKIPEQVTFQPNPDGSYPRFLHNCYGKYQPCEFIPLCWENLAHLYECK
jgi:hypothetical protein